MTSSTAKDKLVLVIDDDEGVREVLSLLVERGGYRVESAADGEEGLHKAEQLKPDLIILDLMLPRYSGFELLRQLQRGGELGKIPIVIVTGRYTDRATADLIRQEPNVIDCLEKPFRPGVLNQLLAGAFESKNTSPETA